MYKPRSKSLMNHPWKVESPPISFINLESRFLYLSSIDYRAAQFIPWERIINLVLCARFYRDVKFQFEFSVAIWRAVLESDTDYDDRDDGFRGRLKKNLQA